MEEEAADSSSSFFSTRRKNDDEAVGRKRRIRKRSHTRRKAPLTSSNFINMAEARKQIVNALRLHRSSSSSAKSITNNVPAIVSSTTSTSSCNDDPHQYYYYYHHQLTDSMPIPEPTWSTTAPAVLCAPVPTMEVLEIDQWFDNLLSSSSSYSWWMGFLNSLDAKNNNANASSEVQLGQYHCNLDAKNHPYSSPNSDDQCLVPTDEWLVFPAAEEGGTRAST